MVQSAPPSPRAMSGLPIPGTGDSKRANMSRPNSDPSAPRRFPVGPFSWSSFCAATSEPSGERRTLKARTLFVFIGAEANTGWLKGAIALDERGFVPTGRALDRSALDSQASNGLSREPFMLESSLPSVFAVGDVRSGSVKRVASAVGEGSMAVRFVHQYLAEMSALQRTRVA